MTDHNGGGTGHHRQPENRGRADEQGVECAGGDKLVAFDAAAGVQQQNCQTFALGVKIWVRGDVKFPIGGNFLRRVAFLHVGGCGTFAQRRYLVFVGTGRKLERGNQSRKIQSGVHGHFRR